MQNSLSDTRQNCLCRTGRYVISRKRHHNSFEFVDVYSSTLLHCLHPYTGSILHRSSENHQHQHQSQHQCRQRSSQLLPRPLPSTDHPTRAHIQCHDPAPIFHFPPPPQVTTTTPPPPATQPARAQQTPVRRQSPASIPLPPSPPPMDICPPSPPHPTLAHLMPQSDVPNLADTYMQTSPSSPKAKYLWEAFNRAKEYASEARD